MRVLFRSCSRSRYSDSTAEEFGRPHGAGADFACNEAGRSDDGALSSRNILWSRAVNVLPKCVHHVSVQNNRLSMRLLEKPRPEPVEGRGFGPERRQYEFPAGLSG